MKARRKWSIGLAGAALVSSLALAAWAFYSANGVGAGDGSVGMLASPVVTATTSASGVADVSWTSVPNPAGDGAPVTYTVDRSADAGTSWSPANFTCAGVLSGTSCQDHPAMTGSYLYRVTARYRSWTSIGVSNSVLVQVATKLSFMTASQTLTAGVSSGTITVQRQDASSTPVTIGSILVTLSSDSPTGIFRDLADSTTITSVTIANGSSTASFKYRDTTAGSPTITASSSGLSSATQQETVNPAAAASLTLAAATTTPTAGAADNLTITAKDTYGNTATSYTGDKTLTFGGASTIGTNNPTVSDKNGVARNFGVSTTITFTNGVATVSGSNNGVMKLYKAETALITVSDSTINNNPGLSVTVSPAAAASLTLAAATTTPTAGAADNLTITAKDTYGNTATSYTGDKTLTFGGASTIGTNNPTVSDKNGVARNFGVSTTITFTNGVATVSGSNNGVMKLYKAETALITVSDSTINNNPGLSVTVSPAARVGIVLSNITAAPSPALTCTGSVGSLSCSSVNESNAAATLTAKISLADQYQNIVTNTTGSSITIDLATSGDGNVTPTGANALTITNGSSTTSTPGTGTFTLTRNNGNNKLVTMTATVHGTSQTLTVVLSSFDS